MNTSSKTMHTYITSPQRLFFLVVISLLFVTQPAHSAQHTKATESAALNDISYSTLPGDRVQIQFTFSKQIENPAAFTTSDPARLAIDFQNAQSSIAWRSQEINIGPTRTISVVEAGNRVRAVINLTATVPYELQVNGNQATLVLEGGQTLAGNSSSPRVSGPSTQTSGSEINQVENIDFRRGNDGQGRVLITMSNPNSSVDIRDEGGRVVIDILNSSLPQALQRRLDVVDFATPVQLIDATTTGSSVRIAINATGNYDQFAYQTENLLSVEFKPVILTVEDEERSKFSYTGERLSLNFQDVEVRAVLQIIADFTGFNLVVSDTVGGNLTLRLNNVPWDHALDIILKTKGLGMRQEGNVVMIAPATEIAAREKADLEANKQIRELAPLRSEFVQINYAKATDIMALIKTEQNNLLSDRGSVSVDTRTNTLLLQDTADNLADIRRVITKLDVPVRQVLIESRIVIANNDFTKELGVQFGVSYVRENGRNGLYTTSGSLGATDTSTGSALSNLQSTGTQFPVTLGSANERLNVSLPAIGAAGSIAFGVLSSDALVDLELSALQAEGRGEVISSPRVVTSDQNKAIIKQGVEVPYQESSSSGATTVAFKEAVLSLEVTPQITPDNRILMDLIVNKDSPDFSRSILGVPPLDTRSVETNVLVDNGETVVLGGVFEQTRSKNITKVPFFGDLPLIGWLFRNTSTEDSKNELLIFVTPRIMKESLGLD